MVTFEAPTKNQEVVFHFYHDENLKQLTRYINRKKAKLKSLLPEGRPDEVKIIQAGMNDPNVLTFSKDILSDG